jgi:hypothetical protein
MGRRNNHYHPGPSNDQSQDQLQAELQAQLQGQLQGQGQGQLQGQGQYSVSENYNGNGNGNLNGNGNGNLNGNANGNANGNLNGNLNANGNLNGNANLNANESTNTNTNTTETTTTVDVTVDLSMEGYMPNDDDMIDLDNATTGDVFFAKGDISYDPGNELNLDDILDGALTGAGNDSGMALGQSNNLYDADTLSGASVSNTGPFTATGTVSGGGAETGDGIGASSGGAAADSGWDHHGRGHHGDDDAGIAGDVGSWGSGNGDDGYVAGSAAADAGAAMDVTAFNQSIVMGANVLGNSIDTTVVGGNMTSTYTIGDDDA